MDSRREEVGVDSPVGTWTRAVLKQKYQYVFSGTLNNCFHPADYNSASSIMTTGKKYEAACFSTRGQIRMGYKLP